MSKIRVLECNKYNDTGVVVDWWYELYWFKPRFWNRNPWIPEREYKWSGLCEGYVWHIKKFKSIQELQEFVAAKDNNISDVTVRKPVDTNVYK